ncbi:GGDEF domain-containing protein [Enterococcus casseliflavus]|uniref:GGDEF domain-containing protein n=1 Tax=Enterococcus casseliflavus TaxID=37734 RepID=UPI002FDBA3AF
MKNFRRLDGDISKLGAIWKGPLIFIMMDLDHFKRINDHYGHITGNRALIFFSKKITTFLSEAHQDQVEVYRYGGEEFLVIFKDSTLKSVQKTILRFQAFLLKNKLNIGGERKITLYFSAGISKYDSSLDVYELINQADQALYAAKKRGRNTVVVYS